MDKEAHNVPENKQSTPYKHFSAHKSYNVKNRSHANT